MYYFKDARSLVYLASALSTFVPSKGTGECVASADIAESFLRLAYIAPVENICSLIDIATTGSGEHFERHS